MKKEMARDIIKQYALNFTKKKSCTVNTNLTKDLKKPCIVKTNLTKFLKNHALLTNLLPMIVS